MKQNYRYLIVILALTFGMKSFSQNTVSPSNSNIQYYGRWDWSNGNPKCTWPSLYMTAKFTGTSITANFTNTYYNGSNLVNVVYQIDGGDLVYENGVTSFTVSGLSAGTHEIMISRRNEANGADLTFNGFEITGGDLEVTPQSDIPCVNFEFVGNSITCGLANENFSAQWNDGAGIWPSSGWEQNSYRSYAPVLSRMMNAQYRIESHSGQGMYINLDNSLPEAKASDEWELKSYYPGWAKAGWETKYDFSNDPWQADFFFTLLGTNDWADGNYNNGLVNIANYKARYKEFINLVFSKYPNTTFFVVTPILDIRGWADGETAHQQIVSEMQAEGKDVHLIDLSKLLQTQQDFGNDWTHPTTKGHQTMADKIYAEMMLIPSVKTKYESLANACSTQEDCMGVVGGSAYYNACDVCVGGTSPNPDDCIVDCHGTPDGTAIELECGMCVGGLTGYPEETVCPTTVCEGLEFESANEYSGISGWGQITSSESNGSLIMTCNATGEWDAQILTLNAPIDFTQTDDKKMHIRAKASGNVILQPTLRDASDNTAGGYNLPGGNWNATTSNVLYLGSEWQEFEIDFTGSMGDQWGCACALDEQNINQFYLTVNPGWDTQGLNGPSGPINEGFTGTIEIDYIRVGCTEVMGFEDNYRTNQYSVYPNPSTGEVFLNKPTDWQLLNIHGELLDQGTGTEINLTRQTTGIYLIKCDNEVHRIEKL